MKKLLLTLMIAVMAMTMSLNARTVLIDEGFENGIQETEWTQEYVYGEMSWGVEGEEDNLAHPSTVHEGTHRAFLRNPSSETLGYKTRLVSKLMDLRPTVVNMPELTFWYANPKWGADCDTLRVLYRKGTRAAWKQLAEYSTASSGWQRVKVALPDVGKDYQIAFEGTDNLGHGIVLDEIKLQSAPDCTIPYDLMVINKGAGKVNLTWSASWDPLYYEVIVSKDTIAPEMIDEIESQTPEKIAFHGLTAEGELSIDLTLEAGEFYLAYVRSICDEEMSAWSSEASKDGPFGFNVRVAKQIPFTETFNYPSGTRRDADWSWGSNTGKTNPFVNSTTTGKARAYYSPDTTAALIFSGGEFDQLTNVIPADRYAYVATPAIADTTNEDFHINQCQVHFWSTVYTNTGRKFGRSLLVGVMEDPADITTFVPVDTVSVWGNMSFVENIVDLSSYQGNGTFLAFVSDFDRDNLFYVDNVTVEYRKPVNKVTKVSVNPRDTYATITWEGTADSYNVLITNAEVNPNNPNAAAIVDQAEVTTNSYVCEALEADHSWNRPYYVYVQAEGQEWSYRYPFVTVAAQREIPYSYTFEAGSTPTYQIGTKQYATGIGVFGNSGNYPAMEINAQKSYVGSGYLSMSMMGGKDGWITLPMVEDLSNTQIKFYLSGYTTYDQAHATVGVMSNPMDINTFVPVADFKLNTTGYTRCYANFENYSGPDGVIAIVWADVMNMSKFTNNYIDELVVEELADCVPPTNMELLSIEPDSITLTWDASSSTDTYEAFISRVAWKETDRHQKTFEQMQAMPGFVLADTLIWSDDENKPVFGIGGLAEHTNYYLYVRADCDIDWWSELSFSTPCEEKVFPWKETFESYSSGGTDAGCWQLKDYVGVDYPVIYSTSNNKYLELYSSGTTHRSMAIMPTVEGTLSDMLLTFDVRTKAGTSSSTGVVYVGTMEDINNQSTFVPFDTVQVSGSEVKKARIILSNYELAYNNLAITSGIGTLKLNSDVLIDNVELKDPSCIDAYDFKQVNPAPHSIDVTWSGVSTNDLWRVKVLNQNASLAAVKNGTYNTSYDVLDTVVTGKGIHVEDLAAMKTYYFYIQTLCADSVWANTSAHTTCEMLDPNIANKETFESYSEGSVPGCWTVGSTSSYATSIPYVTTHGGSNILYLKQSSSTSWAATPEIKCDSLSILMVTFKSGASLASEYCVFGVMTDPEDIKTFVPLDSVKGEGSSAALVETSYDLSEYASRIPAGAKYLAWRGRVKSSDYVYLDDVSIISLACPIPKTSISELTTSGVRVSGGLSSGDQWMVWVTNHSLTDSHLANETAVPQNWVLAHDTTDLVSVEVTGLQGQTRYYIYAASLCEDSVMSQWRSSSFVTPCEAIVPESMGVITFSEEEGFTVGQDGEMPCWIKGSKTEGVSSMYKPYVEATSSMMHNGNNYLKLYDYVSGTTTQNIGAYAIMPALDVDSISKYQVNFWGRSSGSYNNQIIVGVVTDPSDLSTFIPVDTLNLSKTAWDPFSVGFENYEGDFMGDLGTNIMFLSDFGTSNYAYISEVSVELIPHCRAISSFSVDSVGESAAKVSWKGYQDTYRLLLADKVLLESEKATYKYLMDTIVDHSEDVLITNLGAASTYYAYAQGICDGGDSTAISMVYATIRTTCPTEGGAALPFYDDFESYDLDDKSPGCWQFLTVGSHSSWFAVKTVSSNGSKAIDVYSSGGSGCYMIVPRVDGNLENLQLSFDARQYSGNTAKFYVGVMEDVNDVSTFVLLQVFDLAASTNFTRCVMNLADYDLPYDNLVLTAGISNVTTNSYDVYVDNVALELLSTCNSPKLKSVGVTATSAEVVLTPAGKQDAHWQLAVIPDSIYTTLGAAALANYIEQMDKINLDTTYVLIDNLKPATSYNIFARTLCSDNETSAWTRNPLKVTTRFYYEDSYHFGFEKSGELWQRSMYSQSDNYYLHPALITGRNEDGQAIESMKYYPYSLLSTDTELYSRVGDGAMLMYADNGIYGEYVIFPSIGKACDRSFEFQVRQSAIDATNKLPIPSTNNNAAFEIGTVDKDQSFDTYQTLATVRMDKLNPTTKATTRASNNMLFTRIALDLDSATMADKQLVFFLPKQTADTAYLYFDEVSLNEPKGFSLVALKKVVADGTTALVEWYNIGKQWNLKIAKASGSTVAEFPGISGQTSLLVENLEPNTAYVATLELADAPSSAQYYRKSDKISFRTLCEALDADENHAFVWNFDEEAELEQNNILGGDAYDELYLKPSCFQTGVSYLHPVNGYQWLIQKKGYETTGALTTNSTARHHEAGIDDSNSLRIHTTTDHYNSYIVLPKLNCGLDTMMIEFYGRCFVNYDDTYTTSSARGRIVDASYLGSAYSQSMVVGSMTDPMDWNTLHIIDTLHYTNTHLTANDNVHNDPAGLDYWELMQLPLDSAQGEYIVLFQPAPGLFYMDNLSIKPIGNTLFVPTNARTSNITATTASLDWNVRKPNIESVIVLLNGQGQEVFRDTVTGTHYDLTGITPAAMYSWYVYQTDGANDSPATKPVSFVTDCVTNTPAYTCGFEDVEGWKYIDGQSTYKQTLCWTYGDAIQNEWKSATYDPYNQSNTKDYSYSLTGSNAVMLRASYSNRVSYQPYIAMPAMDVTTYDTLQVMFWMRPAYVSATNDSVFTSYTGSTYSKSIIVGTMTDPTNAATFVAIDTVTYDGTLSITDVATDGNNRLYQQMKVELAGATGPYVAFMTSFQAKGGGSQKSGDYVWIDDISFEHRQECKDPTDLEALQIGTFHAMLHWNGIDSAGSYLLQVSTDPYFAEEDKFVFNQEVRSNTWKVEGLEPLTTYVWRVQALCGEKWGESSFSQKATFKTSRSPYFYEPFDASVNANEWTFSKAHADNVVDTTGVVASGLDTWSFKYTSNGLGLTGSHYQAIGYSGDYHWMISPIFYLPEDDSVHFSMNLAMTACNTAHSATGNAVTENDMKDDYYFMIILSDDGGKTWKSENILAKWQNTNASGMQLRDIPATGMTVRYSLAGYAGKNIRIAFYREAKTTSNTGIAIHVDNVRLAYFDKTVDYTSACQYEDIQVGDIYLSGEDTKPGIHAYPNCYYVSDAEAKAGVRDSVQQLEIEVFAAQETFVTDTICEGETYTGYDFQAKDRTGTYRRKLQTVVHGCDSIVTLYLHVKERRYGEDTEVELCAGSTYTWQDRVFNRAGIYRDTLTSSIGCDSVLTLVITNSKDHVTTYRDTTTIERKQLPFTYVNLEHPAIEGQEPIYYPVETPVGTYTDTIYVDGLEGCPNVLIHTLIITNNQGIEGVDANMPGARKLIYRDQLYIILDDEWYNASGMKVADPRK